MLRILAVVFVVLLTSGPGVADNTNDMSLRVQFGDEVLERIDRIYQEEQFQIIFFGAGMERLDQESAQRINRTAVVFEISSPSFFGSELVCFSTLIEGLSIFPRCVDISEVLFQDNSHILPSRLYRSCQSRHALRVRIESIDWRRAPTTATQEWQQLRSDFQQLFIVQNGLHHQDLVRLANSVREAARVSQLPDINFVSFPIALDHEILPRGGVNDKSLPATLLTWAYDEGFRADYRRDECGAPVTSAPQLASGMRSVFNELLNVNPDNYVAAEIIASPEDFYFNLFRAVIIMLEYDATSDYDGRLEIWDNRLTNTSAVQLYMDRCQTLDDERPALGAACRNAMIELLAFVPWDALDTRELISTFEFYSEALNCPEQLSSDAASASCSELLAVIEQG